MGGRRGGFGNQRGAWKASSRSKRKVRADLTVQHIGDTYRIVSNGVWTPAPGDTVWVNEFEGHATSVSPVEVLWIDHPTLPKTRLRIDRSARLAPLHTADGAV